MNSTNTILQQLKAARRVSVPLVAIQTPDPGATVEVVREMLSAGIKPNEVAPILQWDLARGLNGLNEAATTAIADLGIDAQSMAFNPVAPLLLAPKLPRESVLFFHMGHRFARSCTDSTPVVQAIWNLRDEFKKNRRMLVMLGTSFELPAEIAGDVLLLDEPLPDAKQLARIVTERFDEAELPKPEESLVSRAVDAVQGLPAFAAEQVTAMSLRKKDGLDLDSLWERKRQQIEQTPGLKVYRGGETFKDIGGLEQVKQYMSDLIAGRDKPNAITWLDEIDKAMPGNNQDTSGVSQDQLGSVLTFMEDHGVLGVMLLGAPGTGKSAIAKATGNTAGIPTIRFDLGSCKGSLVGESEKRIRDALKIITAVSNDKAMFIATANSISGLDSALKRRFPFVFFFDLPAREEKDVIWKIWTQRYELSKQKLPNDEGWSGANIQKCCECAWRLERSLTESQRYIVPCARVAAKELESLRKQAIGTFLSASDDGMYKFMIDETSNNKRPSRAMEIA